MIDKASFTIFVIVITAFVYYSANIVLFLLLLPVIYLWLKHVKPQDYIAKWLVETEAYLDPVVVSLMKVVLFLLIFCFAGLFALRIFT